MENPKENTETTSTTTEITRVSTEHTISPSPPHLFVYSPCTLAPDS